MKSEDWSFFVATNGQTTMRFVRNTNSTAPNLYKFHRHGNRNSIVKMSNVVLLRLDRLNVSCDHAGLLTHGVLIADSVYVPFGRMPSADTGI